MPIGSDAARTQLASGRFWFASAALAVLVLIGANACGPRESGSGLAPIEALEDPPIEVGALAPAGQAAAGRLLARARDALQGGAYRTAVEAAQEIVSRYPQAPGASRALRILAEAYLGLERWSDAEAVATRYASLFPPSDPRHQGTLVLQAEARFGAGRSAGALRGLLALPPDVDPALLVEFGQELEAAVRDTDPADLEELVADPVGDRLLTAAILTELAVAAHFQGERDEATDLARRALAAGVRGERRELAEAVLAERVEEVLGAAPVVGALLPTSGSPSLRRIAGLVREGVEVAMGNQAPARRPVGIQVADDGGAASVATSRYRTLEGQGVVGIVGPILGDLVEAVARSRSRPIPLISPTAATVPPDADGVYTLSGPDSGQATVLARYANRAGFLTAALVYPRTPAAAAEARAFTTAFQAGGGIVVADLPYEPGALSFDEQFERVSELRPETVVLPVPARELEVLAPQVAFFGLDTLNIRTLGTGGWTSEAVLQAVDDRHTDSVVAVAARAPGKADSTWLRFVEGYESTHRKSLRSSVPALGRDAAGLLLEALSQGARTPRDLRTALERIRDYPGATGLLSMEEGQVVRGWFPVLILDRQLIPLDSLGPPPLGPLEPPPPPPDTMEVDSAAVDTTRVGAFFSIEGGPPPPVEMHRPPARGPGADTKLPAREGRARVRFHNDAPIRRGSDVDAG